jgi:hypothetical protein
MTTPLSPDRPAFKVGDYVLIAPKGIIVFKQPKRIRGFDKYKDGKTYAFFENEKTGVSVDDLIPAPAQTPPPPDDPAKGFGTDNVTAADFETVADAQSAQAGGLLQISRHCGASLCALPAAFVKDFPDAWIEIAFADMAGNGKPDAAEHFPRSIWKRQPTSR